MTAFSVTQDVGATLQAILAKLEKPDSKESERRKLKSISETNPKFGRFSRVIF